MLPRSEFAVNRDGHHSRKMTAITYQRISATRTLLARALQSPRTRDKVSRISHKEVDVKTRINRRSLKVGIAGAVATISLTVVGLAGAQIQKLGGPFTVSVSPAQPPTWTYTVTSDNQNELTSVEIQSETNLSDCTITADRLGMTISSRKTDIGHDVVLATYGTRRLTASLSCPNHEQGVVFLKVTDAGGITRKIGPIAGPK